jgi:hypothetical protein
MLSSWPWTVDSRDHPASASWVAETIGMCHQLKSYFLFLFYFWWYWGFNLGQLPGRRPTTWATHQPFLLFRYYLSRVLYLCPGWPGLWSSCLGFLYSWNDRSTPLHPPYIDWDGVLWTLDWADLEPLSSWLCLPRSWEYRCEFLRPGYFFIFNSLPPLFLLSLFRGMLS